MDLNPYVAAPIRDVNDIIVMQTAIIGEADVLCTKDDDFFDQTAREYLNQLGIAVLDDISLMHRMAAMPFCRSITVRAAVVSSFVRGMVFPSGYGCGTLPGFCSDGCRACFFANCTLNIVLIATMPAKKITSAKSSPPETFPTRNRM